MQNYGMEEFWKRRLSLKRVASANLLPGWSFELAGLATFKEAPLSRSDEFGDSNPETSPLLLISAPGAVGKSTLARQIAFATRAVYLDLAKAAPVGGNTLSGGLVRCGLYDAWARGDLAVLIDGLDEARLRVTQEAFEVFLSDIAEVTKGRPVPTILFGRTGAVQDAWLILDANGIEVPVLEIGYYGRDASVDFAEAHLRSLLKERNFVAADRKALELLIDRLRDQTESDGDRFAGYAPVLQAVAERVAKESNPSALVSEIERGEELVTLRTIVTAILERERGKLKTLHFEDGSLVNSLYSAEEQLERITARVFGVPPPQLPKMTPSDARIYSTALETWVGEHPFLDGKEGASSTVFDAAISSHALRKPESAGVALQRELGRGSAANPFLSEFYLPVHEDGDAVDLPPEHVGIVYASLRARLSLGDAANLTIEAVEDAADEEALRADVEITLARRKTDRARVLRFRTVQVGPIYLGTHVEDVDVTVPQSRVDLGPGPEAVFIAPVSIQCGELTLRTEKIVVERGTDEASAAVYLEAGNFDGSRITSVPTLRANVTLSVSWPGSRSHPWTNFATDPTPPGDPRVDEALRRLRKFVVAFRSHGRGTLARYKHKIEHERMIKGSGAAILALLDREGVVQLRGAYYFLDPEKLAAQTGTNYRDCMRRHFGPKAVAFAKRALGIAN